MILYSLVALLMVAMAEVDTYHILCYHPIASKSHDLLAQGVIEPLLLAGHKITWVTPFPEGKPKNVTIIDVSQTVKINEATNMAKVKGNVNKFIKQFSDTVTRAAFSEELSSALMENQYDAVITEWFYSSVDAGFAAVQEIPWILLSGMQIHARLESLVDTVTSIPILPTLGNSRPIPLGFWDRVNTFYTYLMMTLDEWINRDTELSIYESFFKPIADARGVSLPPYSKARRNVAILLVNSYNSFTPALSLPPNVVEIGGFHIKEDTPPMPKDLQEVLDASTAGVVYFSLGSVIRSTNLPENMIKDLIEVLGKLPYTVLWKYEDNLENLPKNIHIRPWMPQCSILAHNNVKLFITHGGTLSVQEALYYGIPMLVVPFYTDQLANADLEMTAGFAIKVAFKPNIKEKFQHALMEILYNDKYYKKAKYMSKTYRNRPVAPSVLIKHYVELAIENKGARHLRSTTNLYSWYQIWMIDQLAVLLIVLFLTYLIIKKIITSLYIKIISERIQISQNKKSK